MNSVVELREARDLMTKAGELIKKATSENPSLNAAYGYTLDVMEQQLHIMSTNERCYMTADLCIDDVLMKEGEDWNADGTLTAEQQEAEDES
jgi:hypothetical protein